ncbi:MAG: hypothetical protein RIM84_23730 [Alphaproteobacteria bacterium]
MTDTVIDADGHICEPPEMWRDYVPARFRDRVIRVERGDDGRDWLWVNGKERRERHVQGRRN